MRESGLFRVAALLVAVGGAAGCVASATDHAESVLRAATVTIGGGRCAGVVAGDQGTLLTSAHCVHPGETMLDVSFRDGTRTLADLRVLDRERDVAVLHLAAPAHVRALEVADTLPMPGTPLWFTGRNDYGHPMESAVLVRLGRCPSLPTQPQSLFTTIRGIPGDSGAPLVDDALRVVGLVHGGAACSIAVPVSEFARMATEHVSG